MAVSNEMTDVIAEQVADCIAEREIPAINELLSGAPVPAFSRLFQHMLHSAERVDVITTNYDRLLEVQAARVGIGVDSMFYGHTVGKFDPVRSRQAMLRAENQTGRGRFASMKVIPHVRLSKPHGSLDWFTFNNEHFRSDLTIPGSRRIVAPGGNKYRLGYEVPFDQQREQANRAIDSASALLFVGYGFNDDHLQTHIANRIQQVPSVVLSRTITPNARRYLSTSPSAYGIEGHILDTQHTRVTRGEYEISIDRPIWDLNCLLEEVLGK
ncbi:SIR2 family protein [Leucobacter tardus]|uniref:SIR2 family protein n=1 Tax=Leucobacter tardus TaxID=501483 RepID=A0A939QBP0_9MICO|nr:SIR2 family protein [Leucobacter tardus]MBO2989255.1 SIR2 family protein [Leucobacter tardus]